MAQNQTDLPFMSYVRATTQGEVWDHTDKNKFSQFGWRSGKRDDVYRKGVLVGNWVEEKLDLTSVSKRKCLPSRFSHYYETTYNVEYVSKKSPEIDHQVRKLKSRDKYAFPAHQPELDLPPLRNTYNTFLTTSGAAYVDQWKKFAKTA
ncbi:UPF0686 protein C11orf1-like protein [Trichoplax sp. H2]|uniref:Uncharacterized protein n=1 Tax=Trichoplax adhaerens TaxID=10228 RepID=B3RU90_TRIAD|nr:hypothetical protein TRIADDRAFT_55198 [Trichoplax adhaerens]EDV25768.1 hypothetical protein TRIADDRAFT_55198 [Trichoplax adhaerens]RDD46031.1 UPF0686 protein C11orf1-like protein [Trichoplax sp. H2]|eukprot:XP_002111801.1 hypothetical protein TRIADDRAFT_55198 [Trichoplax adhaerens]